MGLNYHFSKMNYENIILKKAQSPINDELAKEFDERMTDKTKIVNTHLLNEVQDQKKRMKVDEFNGLNRSDEICE
jgi:hypothetical protein